MEVPAGSAQSWTAAFSGSYDDEEMDLLFGHIAEGSFVLDIGASLGFYTIPLGSYAKQIGARVVAVEPNTTNCEVLERNVAANSLGDIVSIVPMALGRTQGTVTMHVETGGAGNGTIVSSIAPVLVARHDLQGDTGTVQNEIELSRMDDLDIPGKCSLIKMDVEGYELEVLAGGEAFIAKHRPAVFAECNASWLEARGADPDAPQRWAELAGYACFELEFLRRGRTSSRRAVTLKRLTPADRRHGNDLLFLPKNDCHAT